jgi:protein-L-isoaspartate O-methyltransferase
MLDELRPHPGQRVLEIGTGTGWHAALLAHLVGAEYVTSVEVDPVVAERARAALDSAGYGKVTVITGDGAAGHPERAPYDRVIATVGVARVRYPWVEQTRPGGRLVVPLTGGYQPPGVVALTAHGDGTASGRLARPADFTALRGQPGRHRPAIHTVLDDVPDERETSTDVHPWHLAGDRDAATAIGQRITGIRRVWQPTGALGTLWLYAAESRSWASLELLDQPPYPVRHAGPRPLFDEVIQVYRWWRDTGEPATNQWLVTVTAERQTLTLEP